MNKIFEEKNTTFTVKFSVEDFTGKYNAEHKNLLFRDLKSFIKGYMKGDGMIHIDGNVVILNQDTGKKYVFGNMSSSINKLSDLMKMKTSEELER
jgi:hypothetical protein